MNSMKFFDEYKDHILNISVDTQYSYLLDKEFFEREKGFEKRDGISNFTVTGEIFLFSKKQSIANLREDYYQEYQLQCDDQVSYFYEIDSMATVDLGSIGKLQYAFVRNDLLYFQDTYNCRNSVCSYTRDYAEVRILLPQTIDHVTFSIGPGISRVVLVNLVDNILKPFMLLEKVSDKGLPDCGHGPEIGRFLWTKDGNSIDMPAHNKQAIIVKALS